MKKLLLILTILAAMPVVAMQQASKVELGDLPVEIKEQIMSYVIGSNLNEAVNGIKRLYVVFPDLRKNIEANQAIVNYLINKFDIQTGKKLQEIVSNLQAFEVYKNPEFKQSIEQRKKVLDEAKNLLGYISRGDIDGIKKLVAQGLGKDVIDKTKALEKASDPITLSDETIITMLGLLLDTGASINEVEVTSVGIPDYNLTSESSALTAAVGQIVKGSRQMRGETDMKIVKFLLERGANPNLGKVTMDLGNTYIDKVSALQAAKRANNQELIALLKQHGAKE